jgi:PAS domain S-box-containing protein
LETTNEELSSRTRELDEVNARYSEMLERMPWPVLLADQAGIIYMFNSAAKRLFGFADPSERGIRLEELPMDSRSRQAILRRHQTAVAMKKPSSLRRLHLVTNRFDDEVDVHFTPLARDSGRNSVIVMFEVQQGGKETRNGRKPASQNKKAPAAKKKMKKRKK